MIRDEEYFQSPTSLSGDRLVIIDLGESRTLDTMTVSDGSYGYRDFRAPEATSGMLMGKESDMYAVGRAMIRVLERRWDIVHEKLTTGEKGFTGRKLVPKPLLDAALECLKHKKERRPTAEKLLGKLKGIISTRFRLLDSGY